MTSKGILRFLIGCAIAALLVIGVLPAIGIPRAQILPPFAIYPQAKGKTLGYAAKVYKAAGANPFRVDEMVYYVDTRFKAKVPPMLGAKNVGKKEVYTGKVAVDKPYWDTIKEGSQIPIRYEVTYPDIHSIDTPLANRSIGPGSKIMSGWILYMIGIVVLGYCFAPLIERVALRESY